MMSANVQGSLARFAGFELDLKTGELSSSGRKIRVHEQALRILSMLVARPGEVVTREEIRQALWPDNTVVEFENSMSSAVMRLRRAVGDSADDPHVIETIPDAVTVWSPRSNTARRCSPCDRPRSPSPAYGKRLREQAGSVERCWRRPQSDCFYYRSHRSKPPATPGHQRQGYAHGVRLRFCHSKVFPRIPAGAILPMT